MITENAFNNPDSPRGRILDWLTHHSSWFIAAYVGLSVGTWLTDSNWLVMPALVVVIAFCGAVTVTGLHQELTRICLACMRELPEDAPAQAHRRRWLLRLWHIWSGYTAAPVLLVLLVLPVAVTALLPPAHTGLALAPLEIWAATAASSQRIHHRLRPWCPWCKDWGEDGDIKEPSPDPVNHDSLTR